VITRGALTTFSIANDVPSIRDHPGDVHAYAALSRCPCSTSWVCTRTQRDPQRVIFNALIIIALVRSRSWRTFPRRRRGCVAAPQPLIYGLGGIIAPFIGIKIIDVIITSIHLV